MPQCPICNAAVWVGQRYCSTCDNCLPYPEGDSANENESMQKYHDGLLTTWIGIVMRFFLNAAVVLTIINSILIVLQVNSSATRTIIITFIPIFTSTLFFILFLFILKRIENSAAARRNIDLVSRAIWELNKSLFIRLTIGRTSTFISEEGHHMFRIST